jgi:predicted nicotinamide N-methyase
MIDNFSTRALVSAMAPIGVVLSNFKNEFNCEGTIESEDRKNDTEMTSTSTARPKWATAKGQEHLASLLNQINESKFQPSIRYLRTFLQRYVSLLEQEGAILEDESLVCLLMRLQFQGKGDDSREFPNPMDTCHVSFSIPTGIISNSSNYYDRQVGIQIYPYHNDVGVRNFWEAGAALTEFLMVHPYNLYIHNRRVLELGAGLGLTGLVLAGQCATKSMHLTDYTVATLENMTKNVEKNIDWLGVQGKLNRFRWGDTQVSSKPVITTGYLEWDEFSKNYDLQKLNTREQIPRTEGTLPPYTSIRQSHQTSLEIALNADVLIAADVIYDRSVIPQLLSVVKTLLTYSNEDRSKVAIFATTYRNADTFALFEQEIKKCEVKCDVIEPDVIDSLPNIFPCYYIQGRNEIRIFIMTVE